MVIEPMAESSEMATEAIQKPEDAKVKTGGTTAGEWFTRRIKNQRIKNPHGNFEFSRAEYDTHHQERLGTREPEGKPGNRTQSIRLLKYHQYHDCSLTRISLCRPYVYFMLA